MIKKLRTKFVCITMSIVSVLLLIILGLVYCFTRSELEIQSMEMMRNIALGPYRINTPVEPDGEIRLPYFTVRLGPDGEQIELGGSYYDLSDRGIMNEIIEKSSDPAHKTGIIRKYNLRYCRIEAPRCSYFIFADITSELATLRGLMKNCCITGALGFLAFLAGSIFLSRWAVRPVEEAFSQQKRFIADASHELKTPLTVIMTNAQLLQQSGESSEALQRSGNIIGMSKQMSGLIEQMLCLARADSPGAGRDFQTLDLSRLYRNTVLPFEAVFFERGLELKMSIEENIQVKGNPDSLRRLLEILLDNAGKYSLPGGCTDVSLRRRGSSGLILCVSNPAPEMEQEKLELIFQRFYRADEARMQNGSFGLGLPIALSIARQHGGKIHAEYENGLIKFIFEMNTF